MTPARFGLQALIVLSLVVLVGWPAQRQVRAGAFRSGRDATSSRLGVPGTRSDTRAGQRFRIGWGSASETQLGAQNAAALYKKLYASDIEARKRPAPPALLALGGKINGIVGYTRGGRNAAIPSARVILRNVATGKVEAQGVADELGRFAFLDVMPAGYIAEMVDDHDRPIGASEVVSIGLHELREATVRTSGRTVLSSFGGGLRPAAHDTVAVAAANGVNRLAPPEQCASPPCRTTTP